MKDQKQFNFNLDLEKRLLNPLFEEEKYYFDDFENDKRKNRMFTQKQKDLCWKKVFTTIK